MDKFQLKSEFNENTTKVRFRLNHMGKCPRNECKSCVIETYWSNLHKLIYIAFKLPNKLPTYNKKPLMSPFI